MFNIQITLTTVKESNNFNQHLPVKSFIPILNIQIVRDNV